MSKPDLDNYCAVMREIKLRVTSIESAANGATGLHDVLVQEFCYLQLRNVYELVALSCLVAHGDITSQGLKKEYAAGTILASLEKLQPDFFPWPTELEEDPESKILNMKEWPHEDFMTKEEMIREYGRCGGFLHRGTYKNIFETRRLRPVDFNKIADQAQRIMNLLASHAIMMVREKNRLILCTLNTPPNGGVQAMFLED